MQGHKLPRFVGSRIGPRMEICETSCVPISIVPRMYQSNGYIKRNLRVWRAQKCNALVGAETVLNSAEPRKLPRFMGSNKGPRMEICESSGLPIPMVPRLHQSNAYIERYLRAWRAQKRNTLSVYKPYLPVLGGKLPCLIWSSIGPRMEICEP